MNRQAKNKTTCAWVCAYSVLALVCSATVYATDPPDPAVLHSTLSPYMNAIPPSPKAFCVGTGPENQALHPDRAPHTQLAMQDGVVLFTGTAPQLGVNFQLNAGSLLYSNQMSTLGSPEPPPQVGAAGALLQHAWDEHFLPWSEARWHPGEDISWYGFRHTIYWPGGLPHWKYEVNSSTYDAICPGNVDDSLGPVYKPYIGEYMNGSPWELKSSINLQLSRGLYQVAKVRPDFYFESWENCPYDFREPWFQGRGRSPAFNVALSKSDATYDGAPTLTNKRIAEDYFPNFLSIYPYRTLELEGGRLVVDFERSATWPRDTSGLGEQSGAAVADGVHDEYGNSVVFDRVPEYGWETDFKAPRKPGSITSNDSNFWNLPSVTTSTEWGSPSPQSVPQSWRLPHKRLRSVRLFDTAADGTGNDEADWTVAFVYEHPESDRITTNDTMRHPMAGATCNINEDCDLGGWPGWCRNGVCTGTGKNRSPGSSTEPHPNVEERKSLYSYLPQSDWGFGRLPELNDETTLLTVQVYKGDVPVNGATFQDDWSVWESNIGGDSVYRRVNSGIEAEGDANHDGCPGICGVDDDGDGVVDEDCKGRGPDDDLYGDGCPNPEYDDDEDGLPDYGASQGVTVFFKRGATDPYGDANNDGCPGVCGKDDDGDGLIDEDSNGFLPYLDPQNGATCQYCQGLVFNNEQTDNPDCWTTDKRGIVRPWQVRSGSCYNPRYWRGTWDAQSSTWSLPDPDNPEPFDPFAYYDDDEDGIFDEDGPDDPLLVDLRSFDPSDADFECASGKYPFIPPTAPPADPDSTDPAIAQIGDITWGSRCRIPLDSADDPWIYQVQYVYARSNPYWLLSQRNVDGTTTPRSEPVYYYYPPFEEPYFDTDGNGSYDPGEPTWTDPTGASQRKTFGYDDNLPHVHPDCLPDPDFRGPQGTAGSNVIEPPPPSDIHLIKRVVRARPDVADPTNYTEQVYLYRYNDIGFLKAVFSPADVQALIDADPNDSITTADDILKYADTHPVDGKPLIMYASQWYTYYNPYIDPVAAYGDADVGIPACYDTPPFAKMPNASSTPCDALDADAPFQRLPVNGCDGVRLWGTGYESELFVDPDCSDFMRQDCGWCFARGVCAPNSNGQMCDDPRCSCLDGSSLDPNQLAQMGIPGAQPRFRKYMIKTARMRGDDGEMHLYHFDYLGAASSVYTQSGHITSYADPHNITIVDELVEQTPAEFDGLEEGRDLNEFYIYEDNFRLTLDPAPSRDEFSAKPYYDATTHFLYMPVKVKTRRVVTMNYYGIALSDRLIVTPGFMGDQASLVDNQQYELLNTRGQAKQIFDQSWVAGLRERGQSFVRNAGRIAVQLFGGDGGWYSVVTGLAWGSGGGNLYDQQCKTPEVLDDVPVQRVREDQLTVLSLTDQYERCPSGTCGNGESDPIQDMPEITATYYDEPDYPLSFTNEPGACNSADANCIYDPAGTIGTGACSGGAIPNIDLHNQESVDVTIQTTDEEQDGVSLTHYDYVFFSNANQGEQAVRTKYQWTEPVSTEHGGTDTVAMQFWFYDENGRVRLSGRGSGTPSGEHPVPTEPFVLTYFHYDDIGRLAYQVEDIKPNAQVVTDLDSNISLTSLDTDPDAHTNLITANYFDDVGTLTTQIVGYNSALISNGTLEDLPAEGGTFSDWEHAVRTDFAVVASRQITYASFFSRTSAWRDPYSYRFVYQNVSDDGTQVYGTTTVSVYAADGRLVEERVLGWNPAHAQVGSMNDKITADDFGWGISLADYTYNDAIIDNWTPASIDNVSNVFTLDCDTTTSDGQPDCGLGGPTGTVTLAVNDVQPPYPPMAGGDWPPPAEDQIVTLARSLKLYNQRTTLKPTHEVVFRRYDQEPSANLSQCLLAGTHCDEADLKADPQIVVQRMMYDLEDRIARHEQADGLVSRFLFDPKRRPTKIFKGSSDTCPDWFNSSADPNDDPNVSKDKDDMQLAEHMLYNDGTDACEHSPTIGLDYCSTIAGNDNFPNNAGKLVRTRHYTGAAETCKTAYDPDTPSRDVRYEYDWRGRPVLVKEIAIGYDTGSSVSTFDNPKFISTTSTVYNNLDQPLFVATWPDGGAPDVATIEGWANSWDPQQPDALVPQILGNGALTLSQTYYDDRGRAYEQRTYSTDYADVPGDTYTFTRTWRDDLGRVIGEYGPGGFTETSYDGLGRVLATSHWTSAALSTGHHLGFELTRNEYTYDVYGNVLTQVHYDRRDLNNSTPGQESLTDATGPTDAAIATYTHNWYDKAGRLIATAYWGTGSSDYFTAPQTPDVIAYDTDNAPVLNSSGYYQINGAIIAGSALISRYGYDIQGRRIWSQDAKGVVTRTWYDLLGHTVLEAENWRDPDGTAGPGGTNLTPTFSGPTRYTAYHYTRGGLNDMRVALLPEDSFDPTVLGDPYYSITPDDLVWDDDHADQDFAARGITVANAKVQATRYVYGKDDNNNAIKNIVPEIAVEGDPLGAELATFPNLVSQIEYPQKEGTGAGQPDPNNAVTIKYTMGGQIAERTDQRGVKLRYEYGTDSGSPGGTQLSAVRADLSGATGVDDFVKNREFVHDARGLLTEAWSLGGVGGVTTRNRMTMTYDGYQNLVSAMLMPTPPIFKNGKTTYYEWCDQDSPTGECAKINGNRLSKITYPSGLEMALDYGSEGDNSYYVDHPIGISELNGATAENVVHYDVTGGGTTVARTFGSGSTTMIADFANPPTGTPAGLDRFGRVTNLTYQRDSSGTKSTLQAFHYGYDANGNRTYAWIEQDSHVNDRSYQYQYDPLNRMVKAEFGQLDLTIPTNTTFYRDASTSSHGWNYALDILGNFGGTVEIGVDQFTTTDSGTTSDLYTHHFMQSDNSIDRILVDDTPEDGYPGVTLSLTHDAAGNLTDDPTATAIDYGAANDGQQYVYDAWNRPVLVKDGDGNDVARYELDALGRRVRKTVYEPSNVATVSPHELFYYDGNRVIEWHRGVEEQVVVCDNDPPGGGGGSMKSRTGPTSDAGTKPNTTGAQLASSTDSLTENPKLARQADAGPPPGCHYEMQPAMEVTQRFVWGLDYIDEKIASYGPDSSGYFTLQDANYNVVGKVRGDGMYELYQYAYDPYGQIIAAENVANGQSLDINLNGELPDTHYFAGAWLDKETGLVWMRNRLYSPQQMRFISQDPNGQALVLMNVLARNAQTMDAFSSFGMGAQYADGMNLYGYASRNPITRRDPMGMFSLGETVAAQSIQAGLFGMVLGSIGGAVGDALFNKDSNWETRLTAAGKGAIGGAISGAVGAGLIAWSGIGGLAGMALGGSIEGGLDSGIQSALSGDSFTQVVVNIASGAALGGITGAALGSLFDWIRGRGSRALAGSVPETNPGHPGAGRVKNCVNCSIATDATFAGFPASALPSEVPLPISVIEDLFGTGFRKMAGKEAVEASMSALGPGARGIVLAAESGSTVGHVVNVVVKRNGVVKFFDGQSMAEAALGVYNHFELLITSAPQ